MDQNKDLTFTENKNFLENLKSVFNKMEKLRSSQEFQQYYSPDKGKYYDDKYNIYIKAQDQIEYLIEDIEEEINLK